MTQIVGEPTTGSLPQISPHKPNTTLLVIYLALAGLSFAVLQSLVAPALSTIATDLDVSTSAVSWIITAYLLSASVLTPIFAKLGDMQGKRRILIVVVSLLLVGTIIAALATSLPVMIIGRIFQGAAGAVLPLSIGIVRDELPKDKVSVTIGILSGIFGIGAGVGIVAAGPIVENLDYHFLFWIPMVLIVIALIGIIFGMKESPIKTPGRLDYLGTVVLTVALLSLLLAISEGETWGWGDGKTIGLIILGVVALVAFVLVELRVSSPLIDVRLFKIRGVWTAHVIALVFGFAMYGTFVLMPTLLQLPSFTGYGFGKTASESGLYLLPTVIMLVIVSALSGAVVRRYGPKPSLVIGGVLLTAAYVLPGISHSSIWMVLASGILTGAGIGFGLAAASNAIIESVPALQTGEAISANTIARTIGSSIGTAVIAAVISSKTTAFALPTGTINLPADSVFNTVFWVCAAVSVVAIIVALLAPSMSKRREQALALGVTDLDGVVTEK
ncbi:MFS transporter [Glaciihabitans sp. dw_435]|uniref:MFS transporter n=1 Tax=Glaciihabitans sp. dw_435 TaxID=2720081 RepID=UPI001BD3F612|nr:MFS transporter [Glaciihabitans sp. dw_435]